MAEAGSIDDEMLRVLQLSVEEQLMLCNNAKLMPCVLVGDDAFALKTYIMKAYSSRGLQQNQRIHNYRLSRARCVVENAFGIMCSRFRVFSRPVALSLEKNRIGRHGRLLSAQFSASKYDIGIYLHS